MSKIKSTLFYSITVILISTLVVISIIKAWQEPTASPPQENVPAPINVGKDLQAKSGTLVLRQNTGGVLSQYTGGLPSLETHGPTWLATVSGNVGIGTTTPSQKLDVIGYVRGSTGLCIGNDCRTSWPAGDSSYWAASGANIYNTNNGNVGIGTTRPATKLHIVGGAGGNIRIDSGGNNILYIGHDSDVGDWIQFRPENALGLAFLKGPDTPAMVVKNDGNVGIGTTVPSTKLHIASGGDEILRLQRFGALKPAIFRLGIDGNLVLNVGGGDRLTITAGGNVGIGTKAPGAKLGIYATESDPRGWLKAIHFERPNPTAITIPDPTGGGLLFGMNGIDNSFSFGRYNPDGTLDKYLMYIKGNGNVGIGTTNPGAKLEVAGQIKITGGNPGAGKVLTSDATGLASWQYPRFFYTIAGASGKVYCNNPDREMVISAQYSGWDVGAKEDEWYGVAPLYETVGEKVFYEYEYPIGAEFNNTSGYWITCADIGENPKKFVWHRLFQFDYQQDVPDYRWATEQTGSITFNLPIRVVRVSGESNDAGYCYAYWGTGHVATYRHNGSMGIYNVDGKMYTTCPTFPPYFNDNGTVRICQYPQNAGPLPTKEIKVNLPAGTRIYAKARHTMGPHDDYIKCNVDVSVPIEYEY